MESRWKLLLAVLLCLQANSPSTANGAQELTTLGEAVWEITQPRGQTREIDFMVSEGTWMSTDISPDGRWIVFDLLAHIYRVPVEGGEAECLTQDSGIAVNFQPRYSPDGQTIAFVSDREGQTNPWLMDGDGSNPRPLLLDDKLRVSELEWTPDGQYIVASFRRIGRGFTSTAGIIMFHRDGGEGVELLGRTSQSGAPAAAVSGWPTLSPSGRFMYFHTSACPSAWSGRNDVSQGCYEIWRLDLQTGKALEIITGASRQQYLSASGGGYAPAVSPDGRWLAFARRIPDGRISFKGHEYGPRTALWLRDLRSGSERVLMDPIELDLAEIRANDRLLPAYDWSADSASIVITQGGKLRRVNLATGRVATIPFRARVWRTISERAQARFRISDEPFRVRYPRWQTASPDGTRLAFQAAGRIWVMPLPSGRPRRLTDDSFTAFEYAPSWSPDGRWIAFSSWQDADRGQVWKTTVDGATLQQLTIEAGEYFHTAWSPDGHWIAVVRGAGATARHRTRLYNPWSEIVRLPASGGEAEIVVRPAYQQDLGTRAYNQVLRPSFGPEGRLFYTEDAAPEEASLPTGPRWPRAIQLSSIQLDGSAKRAHLRFRYAEEAVPSPDGKRVAFLEGNNVYLTPLPWQGTGELPPLVEKTAGPLPVRQLSRTGGLYPGCRDAHTLGYGSGTEYFTHDLESGTTTSTGIDLELKRDIPSGRLALVGARIVTLEDRQVIDTGTIVVEGSRIVCVGECVADAAGVVIDAAGKTIIPGFVDMHAHHYYEHRGFHPRHDFEQAIYLAHGVTTNLEPSAWSQNVFPVAELIDAGLVIGPRTFTTGDPLFRGDGMHQDELTSYEITRESVDRLASWGAVSIKQYMQPLRQQRQWVVDAARQAGLTVTAEGDDLEYNLGMIMDGHTAWEHPIDRVPLYADVTRFLGKARAVYSPTFAVGGPGPWNEEFFYQESELWRNPKLRRWLPWRQLLPDARRRVLRPTSDYSFPLLAQGVADVIAEGGYGAIGSHGQLHGIASHWEVWMAAAAMGPMGALEVASLHGATFLGADRDLGSIATGKLADLIVLNSNPLDDIRNTNDMLYVMKGGVLYEADTLDEIWPEQEPYGDYYWIDPDALRGDVRGSDYWDRQQ